MVYGLMLVAAATITPSPTPSPWPCANPMHEGSVVKATRPQASPAIVAQAKANGAKMVAVVRVLLGPDAKVQSATIYTSSGSANLDDAAIASVKASTFAPKVIRCEPVSGVYLLNVNFTP